MNLHIMYFSEHLIRKDSQSLETTIQARMESIRISDLKVSRRASQGLLDTLTCIKDSREDLSKTVFWITDSDCTPVTSSDKANQT